MLEDLARTPATVRLSVPWGSESWNKAPPRRNWDGTITWEVGVTTPAESAAAIVMILLVEPGS